ncbi:hypothetical protein [Legionella maioricensis]|uniref:Coiled-coil-containing protein n=1 Tax=Legionella maioricensis TaxID=2896528 RepID=A0A9X2D2W6_9GAMM|nr:hypothetical protein [Legionella maioricensis]MCL9685065.1 hypothetical protein [Legionella maioricensis]MCL9688174.1 hypothetical protein [Legionella maioricensis]
MSSNKLYNFVHTVLFKNNRQKVGKATLLQQTHLNGTSYYLLQLPKKNNKFPDGLTLTEHHISIYEQPLNIIDKQSEYHYTALFTDEQKRTYRLHVYFDQLDEMIPPPHLALETGRYQYDPITRDEFDVDWLELSEKAIKSVITQLRAAQNTKCNSLKNEINPVERRTIQLSENLEKNKRNYLAALTQQIGLKTQLNEINSKEDKQKEIELMQAIYQQVDSEISSLPRVSRKAKKNAAPATQSTNTDATPTEASKLTKTDAPNVGKAAVSKKTKSSSVRVKVKEEQFAPQINKLSDELLQVEAIADESEKTAVIQVLLQKINEFQLMVPSSQDHLIQVLRRMERSITLIGKKHINLLLSNRNFDEVVHLRALFPVALDDALFNKALMELNADLLSFLLTNKKYNLEQFEPKIHKNSYDSIMDYLFQCDLSSAKVAQCFNILLTHKMSLLRSDSFGLPYLLPLIEDENHPLSKILMRNLKDSPENLRLLKLVINYFDNQKKNFLPDSINRQRISEALTVLKKLEEDFGKKLPVKKAPMKNDLFSRLDSILEESQETMVRFMSAFKPITLIEDCESYVQQQPSKSQSRDIYGGLGLFILPEPPKKPSSPSEEHSEIMAGKKNNIA